MAWEQFAKQIKTWAQELGFQQLGITDTKLVDESARFLHWLDQDFHGSMDYMQTHGRKRYCPDLLVKNTQRILSLRMNYLPDKNENLLNLIDQPERAFISRYSLGRDYHKLMRNRIKQLVKKIESEINGYHFRLFVDSAPVMEKPLAQKAGLGWIGKHTNLINRNAGSWFFLGEIYTDLPLPVDDPSRSHCGTCVACIDICPTQAIVKPYVLDARRCISYLTIELKDDIPLEFRKAIGNRIFGCDDCQAICPWNRFAKNTLEYDFLPRYQLDKATLVQFFYWTENEFLEKTQGSAIRRIGYTRWQRNLAVALGNSADPHIIRILKNKKPKSEMVKRHIRWAIKQLEEI